MRSNHSGKYHLGILLTGLGVAGLCGAFLAYRGRSRQTSPVPVPPTDHELPPSPAPQPGDILLFFGPNRPRDHFIQWVTRSRFYHVGLYAGDGKVLEARPGPGVIEKSLEGREGKYIIIPAPADHGEAALAWARKQLGTPFDIADVFVIGLESLFFGYQIPYRGEGCFTCGWLVSEAFRQTGVDLVPGKDACHVSPADIARRLAPEDGAGHRIASHSTA